MSSDHRNKTLHEDFMALTKSKPEWTNYNPEVGMLGGQAGVSQSLN